MKTGIRFLAVILTVCTLGACSQTPPAEEADPNTGDIETGETEPVGSGVEAINCGGATFGLITRQVESSAHDIVLNDISAVEPYGEILNDEIYERNARVMEKYNLVFAIDEEVKVYERMRRNIQAGDSLYSLMVEAPCYMVTLAAEGSLLPLDEVTYVDLEANWWNQTIMGDMAIFGKHYIGFGDMTIQGQYAAGVIYYSKGLGAQYQLDPYALVREGRWTFDALIEYCQAVSSDLDGQGWDEKDQYGMAFNNFAWQIFFYGIGEKFVDVDEETGNLSLNETNERAITFLQKMLPLSKNPTISLYSEDYKHLGGNYRVDTLRNAFLEGRALFWLDALYMAPSLRDMEFDFGILPVPKYDEDQKFYNSFMHVSNSTSTAIPLNVENEDLTGRVLEDMMYESGNGVRDAFIETTLKGKIARDQESADMISYIIDNVRTDFALLLNSYGLKIDQDIRALMNQGSTDVVSTFAKKKLEYEQVLKDFTESFTEE